MTVCPCCGCKFEGDLREGCISCGAQAVGEPLARPEIELPSYGRALLVTVVGVLLLFTFGFSTLFALFEQQRLTIDFWPLVSAAETAAWRLKWTALPFALASLWAGWLIYSSIRHERARFMGQDMARCGLVAMAAVVLLIATFIGITVPERLRQRERGRQAGVEAQGYTLQRAFLEYRARYKTYPTTVKDLQDGLPDRDGSIAIALSNIDPNTYKPSANLADASTAKPDRLRGVAIRRVSTSSSTDDSVNERFSFTNYEVRLPGEDKTPNTDDDWLMRDGVFVRPTKAGQATNTAVSPSVETTP